MIRRPHFFFWSALTLLAYAGLVGVDRVYGTLRGPAAPATIAFYLLAFAAYLAALWALERWALWPARWVWGTAVAARLLLLLTTPTLSDDVYRMIWDGHVALNGISPYAYAVADPALDALAISQRALVNNPSMASPYLPAAQALFTLAAAVGRDPLVLQIFMVGVELGAAGLIAVLLRLAALPEKRLLLYLWHPLVMVEVAHGAHVDAWMLFLSLLAVWLALRPEAGRRSWLSPAALAAATLTKPLPLLLAPVLFWRWTWAGRLLYPALTALLLLPFGLSAGWGLSADLNGRGLFGALLIYTSRWKFNSGLFHALEALLGGPDSLAATTAAKLLIGAAMLAVLLGVFLLAQQHSGPRATLRLAALPLMAYILLTPTFHPWYLLILLAFVPFLPPGADEDRRWWLAAAPWLWLSGTAVFSYLAYSTVGIVLEQPWVRWLQWGPTWALLLAAGLVYWRTQHRE